MYFPKLHSSLFRKKYLPHWDRAQFEAIPGISVPEDIRNDVIPPAWQSHMVGSFADSVLNDVSMLLSETAARVTKIKRIYSDRRFSAEGVRTECDKIVKLGTGHAKKVLDWIETQSAMRLEKIGKLPTPEVNGAIAAEWRGVIRASGRTEPERYMELARLMRDGNTEAGPSVAAAGHGLSGLDRETHKALRLMIQVGSNSDSVARLWSDAEALDSLRLTALRCTQAIMKFAAVEPMLQTRQEREINSSTPSLTAAGAMMEGIDAAIKKLNESGGFAQLDQEEEEDAPPPPLPPVKKPPQTMAEVFLETLAIKKAVSGG